MYVFPTLNMFPEKSATTEGSSLKKLVAAAVFLTVFSSAFSQVVFFTPEKNISVQGTLAIENGTGFEPYRAAGQWLFALDMNQLYVSAGMQGTPATFDITTNAVYAPTFWNHVDMGVTGTYHFMHYTDMYNEYDVLAGLFFRYHDSHNFSTSLTMEYFRKCSRIFAIENFIPYLTNNSMAVQMDWRWKPLSCLDVYFGGGSYSYFRYMLFFAPDLYCGACFSAGKIISVGTELSLRFTDTFTLSSYFDSAELRMYTKAVF